MKREKTTYPTQRIAECEDCDARWEGRNALGLAALHTDHHGHTTRAECIKVTKFKPLNDQPKLRFRAVHEEGTWWVKDCADPAHPKRAGGPVGRTTAHRLARRFNDEAQPQEQDHAREV